MPTITSEPLTYHRHSRHSYFRDLLLTDRTGGAGERLARHAQEMDVITKERDELAWRSLRSGNFESRVEPSRIDGQGGYFSPPAWLNELFATAKRPGRVLAGLMPHFDLPQGVSQINLPIITTGSTAQSTADNQAVPDQDIADAVGSSTVAIITGQVDTALQLLEQSPAGAHLDAVFFQDLCEAADADLEGQLLAGLGAASNQLLGITNLTGVTSVAYTSASPTGAGLYTAFGQAFAQLGDARDRPPEVVLMRSARWGWMMTQEDSTGLPFGIFTPDYLGADPDLPDPIGGILGLPVFLDDALQANLGAGGNQDVVALTRPSDLILLESLPQLAVMLEPLSGDLGARIQMHRYAAAITNRYTTGTSLVSGTGLVVEAGY